jgi:hypothetical protein
MSISEKLLTIAENEQKVYEKGYADGVAAMMPPSINLVETFEKNHLILYATAGSIVDFYFSDDWYSVHYYEFTKPAKGGEIKIEGELANSFYQEANQSILLVNDGVVAYTQYDLIVSPNSLGGDVYTITLPTDVTVSGIYLNGDYGGNPPVCTYIE